jgi:amino-acid N-acetyltransferase
MSQAPQKVRIAKLQDIQIDAVVAVDLAGKAAMHKAGVPPAEAPARGLAGIGKLTKQHNVLVADADGVVAGYVAWRDESPGVAYIEDLAVKSELRRVGIGTKLIEAVRDDARRVSLPVLLVRCWSSVAPAKALLTKAGFVPIGSEPSEVAERVAEWRAEQEAHYGGHVAREGQVVMLQSLL